MVLSQPPDRGNDFITVGNIAKRAKGIARARAKIKNDIVRYTRS